MRAPRRVALCNGRIILPHTILDSGWVLVEGDRIADISPGPDRVEADEVIHLDGLYLAPGMIDIHIHGSAGVDLLSATADDLQTWARFLFSQGVTRFLPTTVPTDDAGYARVVETINQYTARQEEVSGVSRVLGLHFEGPFVNPHRAGALNVNYLKTFKTLRDLDMILGPTISSQPFVRMMTVAPEIEQGLQLVAELARRGFVLSIGHSEASFEECEAAVRHGVHHVTHFPNALAPLHHRKPGVVGWAMLKDSVTVDMIADGVHVDWTMIELMRKVKGGDRIALISDAIGAAGLGDGEYQIWGETIRVVKGRTENAAGNLAGSVITLREAARNLLHLDFPLTEVMRMVSLVPARVIGLDHELGSIEKGKFADLICFDEQLSIRFVMVGGKTDRF